jgi:probable blue pigment (indigoidine) exporter
MNLNARYLAALAPTVWGSTYLVTTELLPPGRPLLAAAARALPAGLALTLAARKLPHGRWLARLAVLGTLNIGAFFIFLFAAAYRLPGGVAAVVGSVQPLIVLGLSGLWLGSRITTKQVGAAALGAFGVALLVLRANAALDPVGILAALAGACSMAAGIVLTKRWGRPEGTGLLVFTGWQLLFGGLLVLPVALTVEGLPSTLTPTNLAGYSYLAVIGALLAYAIWFWGIERIPPASASFLGLLSPVMASLLGYLALSQTYNGVQLLGAVTVLAAVLLGQLATPTVRAGAPQPERLLAVEPTARARTLQPERPLAVRANVRAGAPGPERLLAVRANVQVGAPRPEWPVGVEPPAPAVLASRV